MSLLIFLEQLPCYNKEYVSEFQVYTPKEKIDIPVLLKLSKSNIKMSSKKDPWRHLFSVLLVGQGLTCISRIL